MHYILFLLSLLTWSFNSTAQSLYFAPRSAEIYQSQIAVLKAEKPIQVYTKRTQQESYEEIVSASNEYAYEALADNEVVYDTVLLNRCNLITDRLRAANPYYPFDSVHIYIYRSSIANAMTVGQGGTIFINLGMFLWIDNDDELAMIIGHELAHYFMHHLNQAIEHKIALISTDEFRKELRSIKRARRGKYLRLKELLSDFTVQTSQHSRYKEDEADSISALLITKAGYSLEKAAKVLLKLDNVQEIFTADSLYTFQNEYQIEGLEREKLNRKGSYQGLSALVAENKEEDEQMDSTKTHPDCISRYRRLMPKCKNLPQIQCCTSIENSVLKERAMVEIVRNLYETNKLTLCIHFCQVAMANGYSNSIYNTFIAASFFQILGAEEKQKRFDYTNTGAPANSTLKELQDFIFSCKKSDLERLGDYVLTKQLEPESENSLFVTLTKEEVSATITKVEAGKSMIGKYPDSKFFYLLSQ